MEDITPELLLSAYANGYFPMGKSREDKELYWFNPEQRGIIPLDTFHLPRSLKKRLKQNPFEIRIDTAFEVVIRACATVERDKEGSWINEPIMTLYTKLHRMGYAHSVECWQKGRLVGGLYGVTLGGAFFGESMFSRLPNASKVALAHLVKRLRAAGYTLLDAQYANAHLKQFGCVEISRADYLARLEQALQISPNPSSRFLTPSLISA